MASVTASPVPAPAANSGYSTREVADTLGLAQQRIRRYRERLLLASKCEESGEYRFSFQDMVLLRTAKGLLEADVAPRRALAALAKLTGSNEKPLSAMRVSADGGTVVVRDGEALWDAETGQGHLSFAARPPAKYTRSRRAAPAGKGPRTRRWLAAYTKPSQASARRGGSPRPPPSKSSIATTGTTWGWIWRIQSPPKRPRPTNVPSP